MLPHFTCHSEVVEGVTGSGLEEALLIDWGDENPIAWDIVTNTRSRAFGANSDLYGYWGWSDAARAPLERLKRFRQLLDGRDLHHPLDELLSWNAQFTMQHYEDDDFTGGVFEVGQEISLTLDYVPGTLQETIERYCRLVSGTYERRPVTLDGMVVGMLEAEKAEKGVEREARKHKPWLFFWD